MSGLNNPTRGPYVRAPRLQVLINGQAVPGCEDASWHSSSHFGQDTWSARFATGADPRRGLPWWDSLAVPAIAEIQVGFATPTGSVPWVSLGIGQIDQFDASPDATNITISGRDLGALMVDTPTAEAFQNQTSAEIVQTIAARHGLTADVTATGTVPFPGPTSTTTTTLQQSTVPTLDGAKGAERFVYRFYTVDHTTETAGTASRQTNEWNLLVQLAQRDGFDLYVTGRTLHYKPLPQLTDNPYRIVWQPATGTAASPRSNAINLRLGRKMMLAKPVTVVVQSFHSKAGKAVTATAATAGIKGAGIVNGSVFTRNLQKPQKFVFTYPNLTQAQADARAKTLLTEITKHERTVEWHEPGDTLLSARSVVRVEGTGSGWDEVYYVDTISWNIHAEDFSMDVTAKTTSAAEEQAAEGMGAAA